MKVWIVITIQILVNICFVAYVARPIHPKIICAVRGHDWVSGEMRPHARPCSVCLRCEALHLTGGASVDIIPAANHGKDTHE